MKIQVTQEHINNGRLCDCRECPIALALRDAGFKEPAVGITSFAHGEVGSRRDVPIPESAEDFIKDFDFETGKAKPFEFEVTVGL